MLDRRLLFQRGHKKKRVRAKNHPSYKKLLPSGLVHPLLITKEPFFPLPVPTIVLLCSHSLLFQSTWGLACTYPQTARGINVSMRRWREGLPCLKKTRWRDKKGDWKKKFPVYNLILVIRRETGVFVCLFACMCVCATVRVNEWKYWNPIGVAQIPCRLPGDWLQLVCRRPGPRLCDVCTDTRFVSHTFFFVDYAINLCNPYLIICVCC